jgi:hypothetical protein
MSDLLDMLDTPTPPKWTERMVLDLIHARFAEVRAGNGTRYVVAEHVRNQCGFGGYWGNGPLRTIDALMVDLWPSSGNAIHGFEVKVSRSDWLTELKDPDKAEAFKPYCDYWWLVTPDAAIVRGDLPPGWGHLSLARNGALRAVKRAPKLKRQDMPFEMTAAWLRATAKTATRGAA